MPDGTVAPVVTEVIAPVVTPNPKVWTDDQVKEIIGTRDDAKKARRDAEAALETVKAEAETLRKAQSQYKADLDSERKKTETYDAEQKKLRDLFMSKIADPDLKEIATKENLSLEALMKLGERQITGPSGDRKPIDSGRQPEFAEAIKAKPNETFAQWQARVANLTRAKT